MSRFREVLVQYFSAALTVGGLRTVVPVNADSWLGLPPAGMETEGQTAGQSGVAHESKLQNSFLPTSTTTLSSVRPCALWMVTAQASFRGSCRREHWAPDADQVRRMGVMGTVPSERVGPE